jgi:hypothetical protein
MRMRDNSGVRIAATAILAVALAGCGSGSAKPPEACMGDSAALLRALASAPAQVRVGGKPISDCFTRNQDGDSLQALSTGLLGAAQTLGDRARGGNKQAALELGYLIGAATRGAQHTGVAGEVVRRLRAETAVGATRQAAYDRGLRAGLAGG